MKVDVLPFLNVSSTLGLPIFCKFEEWKRFAQLLVGKPTLAKLQFKFPANLAQLVVSKMHWRYTNTAVQPSVQY